MSRIIINYRTATPIISLFLLVIIAFAACNNTGDSGAATGPEHPPDAYPGGDLLISAEELADRIDDPDLRVIDLSPIRNYRQGRIPNAVHIWWQDTIEIHNEIYGMMPDRETRSRLFREAGITRDSSVVVYDGSGGLDAARFVWLLHVIGFDDNVALLNGGRQAWEAAGFDLTTDRPDVPAGDIPQIANYDVLIGDGNGDVRAAIDDPDVIIIDGRSHSERQETWFNRLRVGQIPSSIHLPRDETLQDGDVPYFRSPDDLLEMLPDDVEPDAGQTVIVYGVHGAAAAHTWFTMRLLGFNPVRMYDGSWAEWGADPDRPIEEFD